MEVAKKIGEINQRYAIPVWEHSLVYDSTSEQLEPIYFFILDFLNEKAASGGEIIKIEDNFNASVGGGFFSEIGQKATKMQEEGMKIMGTINTLIRTIINLIYDLKDFEIRLEQYKKAESKDKKVADAALLSLKNVWLDKVDLQKGQGAVHQMTYQLGFTTLRDAFYVVNSQAEIDKLDINDIVKRVLKPRLAEFQEWQKRSYQELKKRFEIEKNYLRSEVSALKLYTSWAKPYLKAAEELRMRAGIQGKSGKNVDPTLVTAFNSMILELKILATKEIDPKKTAMDKKIPEAFMKMKFKRRYYACLLIEFKFRGIPFRSPQGHYLFGGRAEVGFKSYALNSDELKYLQQEIDKDDIAAAMSLVEETTSGSLGQMQEDLEHFLEEKDEEAGKTKSKKEDKSAKKSDAPPEKISLEDIKPDDFKESVFRKYVEQEAADKCFTIYDVVKKSKGMASFVTPEWDTEEVRGSFRVKG
jgi:hypothetical protein